MYGQFLVLQAHDRAIAQGRGDVQTLGQARAFDHQRMVACRRKGCRQAAEHAAVLVVYLAQFTMHDLVRTQLALNLAGVISLRLIKTKEGKSMVPACEGTEAPEGLWMTQRQGGPRVVFDLFNRPLPEVGAPGGGAIRETAFSSTCLKVSTGTDGKIETKLANGSMP